jgi:hypothetical protein
MQPRLRPPRVLPTAPLMATPGGQKVESELGLVSPNTSVWQDGFIKGSPLTLPNIKSTSSAKICMTQIGSLETSFLQQRVGEVGMAEVSLSEGSLQTTNPLQISPLQITSAQDSFNQGSPSQVGLTQVCSLQNGTIELSTLQVGFSQNNSLQSLPTKVGTSQIDPGEVALPSSVSVKHFTDIHNPTSNLIALNSTAVSLWQNFHPNFDLTLQVTDLPTGQLAEAQLTGFDANGRPNAGTLLLTAVQTLRERPQPRLVLLRYADACYPTQTFA